MKRKSCSTFIKAIAIITCFAFIACGCSSTRVLKEEIVRGPLKKTEMGKDKILAPQKIYLENISPLHIKAIGVTEVKEEKTKYYKKINKKEIMTATNEDPSTTIIQLMLLCIVPPFFIGWSMLKGYHVNKNSNEAAEKCKNDGQRVKIPLDNYYICKKKVVEEEITDNSQEEIEKEEIILERRIRPITQDNVSVTINDRFKTRIALQSDGTATLKLYEFSELAKSGQGAIIEYQYADTKLSTRLSEDEVQKIFASLTPPHLTIKQKILLEGGLSAGILQADDSGSILVDVLNDGKGPAFGVKLETSGGFPGISYNKVHEIGDIKPGQTRSVPIPVTASLDVKDGKIDFAFQAKEQLGRDSLSIRLQPSIIIKKLNKPKFVLASLESTDRAGYGSGNGNNIAENNETVELRVKVQNIGEGVGKGVSLILRDVTGVESVIRAADLGNIPPGGIKEGRLAVRFPKLYKPNDKEIPLNFAVSDSRPIGVSASKEFKLPYQYNEPILKLASVEIYDGDPNTISRGNMNHLIEQDEEIEMRLGLENEGTLQAEGVSISLTTNKQNVRITPPKFDLGTLPAGEKKGFSFNVEFPASVSPGPITFNIDIKQNDYPLVTEKHNRTVIEASTVGIATLKGGGTLTKGGVMLPVPENIDEVPYLAEYRNKNAYALVMGIGNYKQKDIRSLPFAKSDAESLRSYLENIGGFLKENIQILTDSNATLTEMRRYLKEVLKRRVDRSSLVVIYFSGHGVPESEKKTPYLLPYDGDPNAARSTAYALAELKEDIKALPTKNVVIALDACYTGLGRSTAPMGSRGVQWAEDDNVPTEAIMISASNWDQTAWDYWDKSHGLFTYFLLKGISGIGSDVNGDGFVDTDELFGYLKKEVSTVSRQLQAEQSPIMIGGGKGIRLTKSIQ